MRLQGKNRHMVVEPFEQEEQAQDTIILLPDDYRTQDSIYTVGTIKESSSCSSEYSEGDMVAFPRHLLQEFVFKGETFYLVLENHILCSIEGD
jgi:co-chaperonin GroES (HSP10)